MRGLNNRFPAPGAGNVQRRFGLGHPSHTLVLIIWDHFSFPRAKKDSIEREQNYVREKKTLISSNIEHKQTNRDLRERNKIAGFII